MALNYFNPQSERIGSAKAEPNRVKSKKRKQAGS